MFDDAVGFWTPFDIIVDCGMIVDVDRGFDVAAVFAGDWLKLELVDRGFWKVLESLEGSWGTFATFWGPWDIGVTSGGPRVTAVALGGPRATVRTLGSASSVIVEKELHRFS